MARSFLAILLIVCWIGLSRFDVLEDLDLPDQVELVSSTATPLLDHSQTVRLTHNIVELADRAKPRHANLVGQSTTHLPACSEAVAHRAHKLNKLHRVFLI